MRLTSHFPWLVPAVLWAWGGWDGQFTAVSTSTTQELTTNRAGALLIAAVGIANDTALTATAPGMNVISDLPWNGNEADGALAIATIEAPSIGTYQAAWSWTGSLASRSILYQLDAE